MKDELSIEVVYGTPERQMILSVSVPRGTTVEDAINLSRMQDYFPDMVVEPTRVGIWNKTCKLTDEVRQHDRVEIYRPLIADPKEARRRRAEQAKEEGRADPVTGGRLDRQRQNKKHDVKAEGE